MLGGQASMQLHFLFSVQLPRRVLLTVDDDGLHLRAHLTIPPPREAARQFIFWLRHVRQSLAYKFWPVGPVALATFTTAIVAWVVSSPSDAWVRSGWLASAVWEVSLWMPWVPGSGVAFRVGVLAAWVALAFLLLVASAQHALLRLLLSDKTFLYQARSLRGPSFDDKETDSASAPCPRRLARRRSG